MSCAYKLSIMSPVSVFIKHIGFKTKPSIIIYIYPIITKAILNALYMDPVQMNGIVCISRYKLHLLLLLVFMSTFIYDNEYWTILVLIVNFDNFPFPMLQYFTSMYHNLLLTCKAIWWHLTLVLQGKTFIVTEENYSN